MSSPRSSFIVILNTEEVPSQANWGIAAKNLIENIGGNMKCYNKINNLGSVVEISLNRDN